MLLDIIKEIRELSNLPKIDSIQSFKKICFGYTSGNFVFNNSDFQIESRKATGIIGPNGAGKTTLFKIITDYLEPETIEGNRKDLIIGFSSSNGTDVNPYLTCKKTIKLCLNQKTVHLIDDILISLQLQGVADRLTNSLSSGQRKKISIFRSFTVGKNAILLDEPSAFLDIDSIDMIEKLIKSIKNDVPIVFTTHSKGFLDSCADVVYKIENIIQPNDSNIKKMHLYNYEKI